MFDGIIGKEYGKLKVVSFSRETRNGYIFNCLCNCGRKTTIECNLKKLEKGKVKDCGCEKRSKNLVGERFGKLLVVSRNFDKQKDRNILWNCLCDCGGNRIVQTNLLTSGKIKHCGCDNVNLMSGLSQTKIHKLWTHMINRTKISKSYIKKNIKVCDEWLGKYGFINFYNWAMQNGYEEVKKENGYNNLTIDRIDNNKGYEPDNCRFITSLEQSYNRDNTIYLEYNNQKYNLLELEKIIGKPRKFIYKMWKKGYSIFEIKDMEYLDRKTKTYKKNYSKIYEKGYIPLCDIENRYKISRKRMELFLTKNKIKKVKIEGKNCFENKFLSLLEKYFNIEFEYKKPIK